MGLKITLLLYFVPCIMHPLHKWIGAESLLPNSIPLFEIWYLLLVLLKDKRHRPQRLNCRLNCDSELLRIKILLFRLMPLLVHVFQASVNGGERTNV